MAYNERTINHSNKEIAMNNVIHTFEDNSELTAKQLIGAVVAGAIVGATWNLGRSALRTRKYKKMNTEYVNRMNQEIIEILA